MTKTGSNAEEVFRHFGLGSSGFWKSVAVPPPEDGVQRGAKLKHALEQLGGVYLAFAQFLLWRADLLDVDYLTALRQIPNVYPPVPRDQAVALLRCELGAQAADLVRQMEDQPIWSTLSRTAWLSWYEGALVVVQVARDPVRESALIDFEAGISFLGHPDVHRVRSPAVIRQFRQWLRHAESSALERSYLEAVGSARGDTLVDYPALIPEITTDHVLCWVWVEGEPVSSLIGRGLADTVTQVAVAVLEQYCSLSIVDADLQPDAIVLPTGGTRLAVRRINRPFSVPPPSVNIGMKYIAAVLEGNASITAQTLLTMAVGQSTADLEADLLNLMSGIEPELKVHLWYPGTASAFESNWRALAKLKVTRPRPLYLDCLHRNLIATGYWTAEAVYAGGRAIDTIAEAQWPVVSRILSLNASQFRDPAVLREWSTGLSLLTFGAMREANRMAEEIRDNNLSLEVDVAENADLRRPRPRRDRRSMRRNALVAGLLMALLVSLRWGSTASSPLSIILLVVAIASLLGLVGAVRKIP